MANCYTIMFTPSSINYRPTIMRNVEYIQHVFSELNKQLSESNVYRHGVDLITIINNFEQCIFFEEDFPNYFWEVGDTIKYQVTYPARQERPVFEIIIDVTDHQINHYHILEKVDRGALYEEASRMIKNPVYRMGKSDSHKKPDKPLVKIKNVIYNDPAVIVFWADGTKTSAVAQNGDIYDPEKGLAMAIAKKALGNTYAAGGRFKKWLPKEKKPTTTHPAIEAFHNFGKALEEAVKNAPSEKL